MSNKKSNSPRSILGVIGGIVLLIVGFFIYQVTGIDLFGINTTPAPQATAVVTHAPPPPPGSVRSISVGVGSGATKGFWEAYFTDPPLSSRDTTYDDGIDVPLANAIANVQRTLDIAAYEMDNELITQAILDAHNRGVRVRVVSDDEAGLEEFEESIPRLQTAGIPVVDDERSGLMHNKFMIMDGQSVWMGSMNYTRNGVYRNNNNLLRLDVPQAVQVYQAEFDEMFSDREFGITSSEGNTADFTYSGTPMEIYFASENNVVDEIIAEINSAQRQVRFMVFSFTRDDMGDAMLAQAERGIDVEGVFETTGSETRFSEMTRLFCAGLDVRQDGNGGQLHHKVVIIDDATVITGSFNFSNNAVESNDENLLIIQDTDLARLFLLEFQKVQRQASRPDDLDC